MTAVGEMAWSKGLVKGPTAEIWGGEAALYADASVESAGVKGDQKDIINSRWLRGIKER